jgi:protein-tyrosine-phosphatase/DNA-binding transcriptional ArsR family regulator
MSGEADGRGTIEMRVRWHAALGDPYRLAIVDQLALGDVSPGELGVAVNLSTNLLAHHLKVLTESGLVHRVRSQGDRRRSYVHLRWEDPAVARLLFAAVSGTSCRVPRVLFVCARNSVRSQLAAAVWARVSRVPVASAGTHPAAQVHPGAVKIGWRHGLRLARARTRLLADALQPGDLIVAVCDNAHEELVTAPPKNVGGGRTLPSAVGRGWLHWAVPDPAPDGADDALERTYADLFHRIERLSAVVNVASGPATSVERSS